MNLTSEIKEPEGDGPRQLNDSRQSGRDRGEAGIRIIVWNQFLCVSAMRAEVDSLL